MGPGLLFASAAVGVSHLVQSTRAGAGFGLTLAPLLVLVCLVKYPMFRFGAEYSAVTGENVVDGYARRGPWLLGLFMAATVMEGVGVMPAVSLVTAGLTMHLLGLSGSELPATVATVVLLSAVLAVGRYRLLEQIGRVFVVVFSVMSVLAAIAAATRLGADQPWQAPFPLTASNLAFAVAVAGWMPIGAGGAAFLSSWVVARARGDAEGPDVASARFDFHVGYVATVVVALCFLLMGTALIFGTGTELSANAGGFSTQLVELFAQTIGPGARLIAGVAALAVMASTVLASGDGFPRVYAATTVRLLGGATGSLDEARLYRLFVGLQLVAALLMLGLFFESFPTFIDLVTTVGFFAAPVIAFLNHRIMCSDELPREAQPPMWLRQWSLTGMLVLGLICPVFLYFRFS